MSKQHIVFDCECIGAEKPVFLVCTKNIETQETRSFWAHKKGHMKALHNMLLDPSYTWVSFNGNNFDAPLISAAIGGADGVWLKETANEIITQQLNSWRTYKQFNIEFLAYDHIDLIETAPGVMISLKTYAGRMSYPSMVDMPFDHNIDLTPRQHKQLEAYCLNDLGVTEELFHRLKSQLQLRVNLGERYNLDLRSKSDAQCAESVIKKELKLLYRTENVVPHNLRYKTPDLIVTKSPIILDLIEQLEAHNFSVNRGNGSPELPAWLSDSVYKIGSGTYQVGIGGLHSTHDTSVYYEATEQRSLSDFDVASYYPNIMMKCGIVPHLPGNKGIEFMRIFGEIYEERMAFKRSGNKIEANSLKTVLNGTFGKLGNLYSAFYSPALLLAVTITGQLNLLCLIDELEKIKGVYVRSANTDGIMVDFPITARDKVLKVFAKNVKRTGFEYEETPYRKYAAKDVNNYIAVTVNNELKRKGLYSSNKPELNPLYLMKNPTMEICSTAAALYLLDGTAPAVTISTNTRKIEEFVAIRNVKGGGVQHTHVEVRDDWFELEPGQWARPNWTKAPVKRKSRPKPYEIGIGGTPFGRVARWYMTTEKIPPLTYVSSGNLVPKTEGAKLCMTLPTNLPKDLNLTWYITETISMLNDMGVKVS
jgi:hypothetical protein